MNSVVTRMDNYFSVYIHVPKLKPSGKKETFVRYHKSSKDYRIHIPGSIRIEFRKDATFEEEMVVRKGRGSYTEINDNEEIKSSSPPNIKRDSEEKNKLINPIDPVDPDDAPTYMVVRQKRPIWEQ